MSLAVETKKYQDAWSLPGYSKHSPGENFVDLFWDIAKPKANSSVLDVGAGAGAASRVLKDRGLAVTAVDLTNAGWKQDDIHLAIGTIWKPLPVAGLFDNGFCCDVMEHLPTEYTALAVSNIMSRCAHTFFSISFEEDNFGALVGSPLHLTVKPFIWWRDMLSELGTVLEARDVLGDGIFYLGRK